MGVTAIAARVLARQTDDELLEYGRPDISQRRHQVDRLLQRLPFADVT